MADWSVSLTAKGADGSRTLAFVTISAALAYPFLLDAFHAIASSRRDPTTATIALAAITLAVASAVPLTALGAAYRLWNVPDPTPEFVTRARWPSLVAGPASPPLYVCLGVVLGLIGIR